MSQFQKNNSFEKRIAESNRVKIKYPDKLPIIIEKDINTKNINEIDKKKYLVPSDLTLGQLIFIIRKRLKIGFKQIIIYIYI